MQVAHTAGKGNITVQQTGQGNYVQIGTEHIQLELTRFTECRPAIGSTPKPLTLLSPYSRASTLRGRDNDLYLLDQFVQLPNQPILIRVITGAGGSGKTRLALELCERWAAQGWQAGFATSFELNRFFTQLQWQNWEWEEPTLVVIDYASIHKFWLKDWLTHLTRKNLTNPNPKPIRFILLERHAHMESGWMRDIFKRNIRIGQDNLIDILNPPEPVSLKSIISNDDRTKILNEILDSLGQDSLQFTSEMVERHLNGLEWQGMPLFLMIAGISAANTGSLKSLQINHSNIIEKIAEVEYEKLVIAAQKHRPQLSPELLCHLAACITLAQGCIHEDLFNIITQERLAIGRATNGDDADYINLLAESLMVDQKKKILPILPDLIGEAFIMHHFLIENHRRDIKNDLMRLILIFRTPMIQTIMRCIQDFSRNQTNPHEKPPLSWLLDIINNCAPQDSKIIEEISNNIHFDSSFLHYLKISIENKKSTNIYATTKVLSNYELSIQKRELSIAYLQSGKIQEAKNTAQESVDILRELYTSNRDLYIEHLSRSLENLSNILNKYNQHTPGLLIPHLPLNPYTQAVRSSQQ